jgi:hypothetical protein
VDQSHIDIAGLLIGSLEIIGRPIEEGWVPRRVPLDQEARRLVDGQAVVVLV